MALASVRLAGGPRVTVVELMPYAGVLAPLAAIRDALEKLDPTLAEAAQNAGTKMRHQLEALHTKAGRAELRQSELIGRHAETLSETLYPEKGLQERDIAGVHFIARYGADLLQQIYEVIHTDCHDHQILEV